MRRHFEHIFGYRADSQVEKGLKEVWNSDTHGIVQTRDTSWRKDQAFGKNLSRADYCLRISACRRPDDTFFNQVLKREYDPPILYGTSAGREFRNDLLCLSGDAA